MYQSLLHDFLTLRFYHKNSKKSRRIFTAPFPGFLKQLPVKKGATTIGPITI